VSDTNNPDNQRFEDERPFEERRTSAQGSKKQRAANPFSTWRARHVRGIYEKIEGTCVKRFRGLLRHTKCSPPGHHQATTRPPPGNDGVLERRIRKRETGIFRRGIK
jgi:hypothetical protein